MHESVERSRAVIIGLGAFFILAGLMVPAGLTFYEGSNEIEAFVYSLCSFVLLIVIGTTILIVGIARSDRRTQQQQQQIVVMTGGAGYPVAMPAAPAAAAPVPAVRCARCGGLSAAGAKFCKQCGTHLGGGQR